MDDSLGFTADIIVMGVDAAMAIDRTLRIELFVAFPVARYSAVSPHQTTLAVQSWTVAIEAVALVHFAKIAVLPENVVWTFARAAGANFR